MAATPATAQNENATTEPHPVRRSGWSLFWGGMGFAGLLLTIGLLTLLAIGWKGEGSFTDVDTQREAYRAKVLADRVTEDHKLLYEAPTWFAKDKGLVRVPIDQAVAMTMPRLQSEKPHAAYPLSQSPPQPAAAPTSPGVGSSDTGGNAINPPSSNPTVGQTSASAPIAAPAPSAAPATAKSSPPPGGVPNVGAPGPAAPAAPGAAPAPTAAPTPAHTGEPVPGPTPMPVTGPEPAPNPAPAASPAQTPPTPAPAAMPKVGNNANNPGNPPVPGTAVQPAAPSSTVAPLPTPNGATSQPNNAVPPPPKPSPSVSSSPDPKQDTASPAP